jgi:hypothetical protein
MKILINPEWISLVKDLTKEQKAELLICLLSYPAVVETDLGAWEFMRKQIDRDTEKYQTKVENISANRQKRWAKKQKDGKSPTEAEQNSQESIGRESSIERETEIEKEKSIENKKTLDRLIKGVARGFDANAPARYTINDDFDFDKIAERDMVFRETFYSGKFTEPILEKAQRSLRNKCYGMKFTIQSLIEWVEREGKYPQ